MAALIGLTEAKSILNLQDSGQDTFVAQLIEGVTSVIEHEVGAVTEREVVWDIRQGGSSVVLPDSNVLELISGKDADTGADIDVARFEVVEGGILCARGFGCLPARSWKLTARIGMDPIPEAIRRAAAEVLKEAFAIKLGGNTDAHTRPFLISYRTMVWLEPYRDEAGFA